MITKKRFEDELKAATVAFARDQNIPMVALVLGDSEFSWYVNKDHEYNKGERNSVVSVVDMAMGVIENVVDLAPELSAPMMMQIVGALAFKAPLEKREEILGIMRQMLSVESELVTKIMERTQR